MRWPVGKAVSAGRSACDSCGVTLSPRDLVPLVSVLLNRFKCRQCGAEIDPLHWRVESVCAVSGLAALARVPGLEGLAGLLFGCALAALAALDFRHFWLPDGLTFPLVLVGLGFGLAGVGWPLEDRLIGAASGFAILWAAARLYRLLRERDGLGGGDPKLLGGIGAWLGWQALPLVITGAGLTGLAWLALRMARGETIAADIKLPFGALMAMPAFAIWLWQN